MPITDWPDEERPRERLLRRGAAALSDAELLAIFLRTGVRGKTAVDLARELLAEFGSLRALLRASREEFCAHLGLGDAKYAQLQAVLAMARRHLGEEMQVGAALTSPNLTRDFLTSRLRDRPNEVFAVLFLDSQHRMLHFEELFTGTLSRTQVHPRVIAEQALTRRAAAVILAHNHPSGLTEPSDADRSLTAHVCQALGLLDIRVLDHFIIGEGPAYSFAENGLI